jgi:hypothetical protein
MINVVFSLSSKAIFISFYPKKPSIKEYKELRTTLSTKTCVCVCVWGGGTEKSSLRLALFRSLKSMQTLIFLFFFGTIIILDTHCGYLIASKKSVFYCFLIYVLTLIRMSEWVLLNFYLSGLCPSTSDTLCTMIFISKLGISL